MSKSSNPNNKIQITNLVLFVLLKKIGTFW